MKYLVIGAILALVFIFIYSRLEPYIGVVLKIIGALRGASTQANSPTAGKSGSIKSENKLIRCVACGTWIPAERAIGPGSQLSAYCSRECLEKSSGGKERKLAG